LTEVKKKRKMFGLDWIQNFEHAIQQGDESKFLDAVDTLKKASFRVSGLETALRIVKFGHEKMLSLVSDAVGEIHARDFTFVVEATLQDFVLCNDYTSVSALTNFNLHFEEYAPKRFFKIIALLVTTSRMLYLLEKIGVNLVTYMKKNAEDAFLIFTVLQVQRKFEVLFYFETHGCKFVNDVLFVKWKKIFFRTQTQAVDKIRLWWLPLCYSMKRETGKRMFERNFLLFETMYSDNK
jgi:hypothetical protein